MQIVPAPEASTQQAAIEAKTPKGSEREQIVLAKWAFPPTWRVLECGSESRKGKTTVVDLGICDIRSFWLQVLGFPHARPRMYRFEVWVAACILIEAHSHTTSSFRRIKL